MMRSRSLFLLAAAVGFASAGPTAPFRMRVANAHRPASPPVPGVHAVQIDLTGCYVMGASNGKQPAVGCGVAPLDDGDGQLFLAQSADGAIDACISQRCYRPAAGRLINTSSGAGMLRLQTLTGTGAGNCSSPAMPHLPADGLLEHFNWIVPLGWPLRGNATWGTRVDASDLSGTFVNNDNPAGDAGGIFLRRLVSTVACDHMRRLPDCTAAPTSTDAAGLPDIKATWPQEPAKRPDGLAKVATEVQPPPVAAATDAAVLVSPVVAATPACAAALAADCGAERGTGTACMHCLEQPTHHADIRRAGCNPPDVAAFCGGQPGPAPPVPPSPLPPETSRNVSGCYRFGGSAGRSPLPQCGMAPARTNGHAYVAHQADGIVRVCLVQFCTRRLIGTLNYSSNGVGFMVMQTDLGVGNCTRATSKNFPEAGLFAHIDFLVPAGWPSSGATTRGTRTDGDGTHTLSGMFVNNGPQLAGFLKMDPNVDPADCGSFSEIPWCANFVPPFRRDVQNKVRVSLCERPCNAVTRRMNVRLTPSAH